MEKLNQIIDSGELRQVLERRFVNPIVEAIIDRVSRPEKEKCAHKVKLQAAEEMAKALREITDFYMNACQCTLSNDFVCVVHRTKKVLTAWEKAKE